MNMVEERISEITAALPKKITGGRLSELLERIPYLNEAVQSVQYLEDEHAAYITLHDPEGNKVAKVEADLAELFEALLASKILPQKILKTRFPQDVADKVRHPDQSQSYYNLADIDLIDAIDRLLVSVANRHGATHRVYPSIYSAEIMNRNGYHKNFPQNVYSVSQIPHNYTLIKNIREDKSSVIPASMFESLGAYLQPCVCYHCYAEIQQSSQTNAVFSAKGRCFRHEIQWKLNKFRRNEFTMREIVFFGDPQFVESKRHQIMDEVWQLFCDLGLSGQIVTARDPFFHYDDMKTKGAVQLMADAKYELEFVSNAGNSSSIASFNNCMTTLCEKFEISSAADGEPLHSGCVAFGIDRWRAALFECFGPDRQNWPALLQSNC